jgi:hypothetical protein
MFISELSLSASPATTVIEFGLMGIKPDHAITYPTRPEGQLLKRAWQSVTAHMNGPRRTFGGTEAGDASRLWASSSLSRWSIILSSLEHTCLQYLIGAPSSLFDVDRQVRC